ncbi:MAG: hypothetical protein ACREEP_04670, partial [Dongiaceae bacterium]
PTLPRLEGGERSRTRVPCSPLVIGKSAAAMVAYAAADGTIPSAFLLIADHQSGRPPMKKLLAALALSMFMSGAAFANSCPTHMKAIDAALAANPQLTAEQLAEVKEYREEGEKLHNEGKHADSLAALKEAEEILGIAQ